MDKDGTVLNACPGYPKRINRIPILLQIFEKNTCGLRGRICTGLNETKREIFNLYSPAGKDAFDLIDKWRNDLLHGTQYWQRIVPIIMNLICLLLIDEIGGDFYSQFLPEFRRNVNFEKRTRENISTPFEIYVPRY